MQAALLHRARLALATCRRVVHYYHRDDAAQTKTVVCAAVTGCSLGMLIGTTRARDSGRVWEKAILGGGIGFVAGGAYPLTMALMPVFGVVAARKHWFLRKEAAERKAADACVRKMRDENQRTREREAMARMERELDQVKRSVTDQAATSRFPPLIVTSPPMLPRE